MKWNERSLKKVGNKIKYKLQRITKIFSKNVFYVNDERVYSAWFQKIIIKKCYSCELSLISFRWEGKTAAFKKCMVMFSLLFEILKTLCVFQHCVSVSEAVFWFSFLFFSFFLFLMGFFLCLCTAAALNNSWSNQPLS